MLIPNTWKMIGFELQQNNINNILYFVALLKSRFRQLEEMRKAINRVVMRFVAFYASKEMLYGNSS